MPIERINKMTDAERYKGMIELLAEAYIRLCLEKGTITEKDLRPEYRELYVDEELKEK